MVLPDPFRCRGAGAGQSGTVPLDMRNDNPLRPRAAGARPAEQHRNAPAGAAHRDVPAAIAAVRPGSAQPAVKLAFEFLVLTATWSGEVRGAHWDEIDTADHVCTLSARRIKAKRPAPDPAVLEGAGGPRRGANARRRQSARVPDAEREADLGAVDAGQDALQGLRVAAVPHGFRPSFRHWAAEQTNRARSSRRRWLPGAVILCPRWIPTRLPRVESSYDRARARRLA